MSLLMIFAPATILAAIMERPRKVKAYRSRHREVYFYK